jgi:putative PIG3 family NAD(P)H quinone oxidoreductase
MLAVLPKSKETDPVPRLGELPDPEPGPGEVLIDVAAAGINHADLLQLRGLYPPPPGESEVPGLEAAGRVAALGEGASHFRVGDRVMALLAGGGHATRVAAPEGQVMALPENLSWVEGGALPEAGLTAWTNLVAEEAVQAGESVLVTGATGGMGTMFVGLARELDATVIASGRDPERLARLAELGAVATVPAGEELSRRVREATGGRGADLVIDLVGGEGFAGHLAALRDRGRLVLVGVTAGSRVELELAQVLRRRLRILGSVLRARPREEKSRLVAAFADFALPRLADGRLRAVVDRTVPFEKVAEAYDALRRGGLFGKVVLEMR